MRLPFLLLAAALLLPACDSQYDDGYNDGFFDGQSDAPPAPTNGATFVDFTLDGTRYEVNDGDGEDQRTATYRSRSISSLEQRNAVERALGRAGDGALVMLYIQTYLVSNQATAEDNSTYSALPVTRGFEEIVLADSVTAIPVVGYTASYEFSFDNQDLYFDVVSSTSASQFGGNPRALFNFIVPQETDALGGRLGADVLRFRLVTVPATRGNKTAVDLTDYAAVKAAYGLPD